MKHFFFLFIFIISSSVSQAKVDATKYGITYIADTAQLYKDGKLFGDSVIASHTVFTTKKIGSDIETAHPQQPQTADFYFFVFLCLLLGIIRFMDTKYFNNLWRALINPNLSSGQIKDQIQGAGLPNILMNVFFTFSIGTYIYYIVQYYMPTSTGNMPSTLFILILILGAGVIYITKYIAIRFSGWAFKVEGITEHYLFNVFLINKIIGIILLPIVLFIAFGSKELTPQVVIFSFIITGILMAARYIRSWQVFGSFLEFSKFHFFLYLCASELLPLAVLIKLLINGLMVK